MKKVLIVDDDSDLLKLYKQAFLNASIEVDESISIEKAEKLIKENVYDLILLDLMFPDTNVLQTILNIRKQNSPNTNTPIIVLTNMDSGDLTDKAIEYGANECLFKATQTPKTIFEAAMKFAKNNSNGNNHS